VSQVENEMSAGDYSEKNTIVTRPILCYEMLATMTSSVMARHKAVNVSCCCLASSEKEMTNSKSLCCDKSAVMVL
jgi:hypothetical protein